MRLLQNVTKLPVSHHFKRWKQSVFGDISLIIEWLTRSDPGPPLAAPDKNEILAEIDILDAETNAFHEAQAATVEDFAIKACLPAIAPNRRCTSSWVRTVGGRG
jgi:hypothetical protein